MNDKYSSDEIIEKLKKLEEENILLKMKNLELEEYTSICKKAIESSPGVSFLMDKQKSLIEENLILKQRIKELEYQPKENISYTIMPEKKEYSEIEKNYKLLLENNSLLRSQLGEFKTENKELKQRNEMLHRISCGILGYKIEIEEKRVKLLSIYAFDYEDAFLIEFNDSNCKIIDTPIIKQYINDAENFIIKKKSIPAFFSKVTLSLFEQKTFGE